MFNPRRSRRITHDRNAKKVKSYRSARVREHTKVTRSTSFVSRGQPFDPSEDWHEPTGQKGYRVVVKKPGTGYRHVVTEKQVRTRLAKLPKQFLKDLEVVQLGCMTRKRHRFPCYGLQWGCAIYLYPFEENFEEIFYEPPPRAMVIESKMFGARWDQPDPYTWRLIWTEQSARDFQLNNVLIHELGHLIDNRNTSVTDQERFAEWFAIQYGYLRTGGKSKASRNSGRKIRRRHHGT